MPTRPLLLAARLRGVLLVLACTFACGDVEPGPDTTTDAGTSSEPTAEPTSTPTTADTASTTDATSTGGSAMGCVRDPDLDADCEDFWGGFGEDYPEAWQCAEGESLQGDCSSTSFGTKMWMGFCCPADSMP